MAEKMKGSSAIHSRKVIPAFPLSRGRRKFHRRENKLGQLGTGEFLWMVSGAAVVGAGVYLLSFMMV